MKRRLSGWDTYVQEAANRGERSIELPLTEDENYVIPYPTRRSGRAIARAQAAGDLDELVIALLGEEAGGRVKELAEDEPGYVLDEFLIDVMKKFGMIPNNVDPLARTDEGDDNEDDEDEDEDPNEDADVEEPVAPVATNGSKNGRARGKAAPGKSKQPSVR